MTMRRIVKRVEWGLTELLCSAIRVYQIAVSPLLGAHCRFHPSCSRYAAEAIRTHGAARGLVLAGKRVARCHPFAEGGLDPVPEVGATVRDER